MTEPLKPRALKIISIFEKTYPKAAIALSYKNPFQLLVVTILSAQSTDKQVNKISPALFKRFKTIKDLAEAKIPELEKYVHSTGFYHNKAKNIKAAAQKIRQNFNGKVPNNMEELTTLPGVARKTANIVLSNSFGIDEGIAVDTHVKRLSQRLGFSKQEDPNKIEQDLMAIFPKKIWGKINHLLVHHGRAICDAKKPQCLQCPVCALCPSYRKSVQTPRWGVSAKLS
jgi:endonuclease-3